MATKTQHERILLAHGVEAEEAALISEAIKLSRRRGLSMGIDASPLAGVTNILSEMRGSSFRKHHELVMNELAGVSDAEAAFGDLPDSIREQHAAFCYEMFKGNQTRFLDRHAQETPEEYFDRPRKATMNITQLVIHILSKLYHKAPQRTPDEGTPESIAFALEALWSDLMNLTMLEADRYTRLVGTVAIRPFYDPDAPGAIRPWVFMSHQLRVILDKDRPWKPAAVIERPNPFGRVQKVTIWTDKSFVTLNNGKFTWEEHGLGRVPHVFMRDRMSFTSFFVEGRGRILCDPNAILNNDLTDLEEIKQLQGFAVTEIINPTEDQINIGPRQAFVFKPQSKDELFGVNFKTPNAPIDKLRADIEAEVSDILRTNRIPPAALGAQVNSRSLSGASIREAMAPLIDDLEERARLMVPVELDYADSALRMLNEHHPNFSYDHRTQRVGMSVDYTMPSFPLSVTEQVAKDGQDVAFGKTTPAALIRREDPDRYPTHDSAVKKWKENLAEMESASFERADDEPEDQQASFEDTMANDSTPLMNILEDGGLIDRAS